MKCVVVLRHELIARIGWLLVGCLSLWRGWSYVWPGAMWPSTVQPQILEIASSAVPLWLYAALWITAGAVALLAVLVERLRPLATALNFGLYLAWTLACLGAWAFLGSDRVWVSALNYAAYGWLTLALGSRGGHGT